jgi:hypothetical protein
MLIFLDRTIKIRFTFWAYETASGLDDFKFLVNDGTVNSNMAFITIVIHSEPPNIAPVAQDSKQITYKNQEMHGRLNAVDANKDQLMFMISKFPANGIFVMSQYRRIHLGSCLRKPTFG